MRAAVPMAVGVLLYIGALNAGLRTFPGTWFYEAGPGSGPPWYFIGQDAVAAAWAAGGFLLLCVFTLLAARPLGPFVWAAFAVNAVSFVERAGLGVNVWIHTSDIRDRSLASTTWGTFDGYLASQGQASNVSLAVGVALAVGGLVLYARGLRREAAGQRVAPSE